MQVQALKIWDRLRTSFWFVPTTMIVAAVALAYASIAADETFSDRRFGALSWIYGGGAEGARAVLQTIAGSMVTIAGVVFSLTLVALTLASSQFGPRLLRNFMRDRSNQVVLGTFLATFAFCLFVLRTLRFAPEDDFVPHLSVTLGLLLAFGSVLVLIYFIHHVSVSIQADEIIARIAAELDERIEKLFPEHIGQGREGAPEHPGSEAPERFDSESRPVHAASDGYLQLVDADALMKFATGKDAIVRVERRPGHYVVCGSELARAWPAERLDGEAEERLRDAFVLGEQRTPEQDVEFAIVQLVEIAVRALSPGVNEPFTAVSCVDRLSSALCRLVQRRIPSACRFDEQQKLRVIAPAAGVSGIVDTAFNQIRQAARADAAVTIRLLEAIAQVAAFVTRNEDRVTLRRHADLIARGAREGLPEEHDREMVEQRYAAACSALGSSGSAREPGKVRAGTAARVSRP